MKAIVDCRAKGVLAIGGVCVYGTLVSLFAACSVQGAKNRHRVIVEKGCLPVEAMFPSEVIIRLLEKIWLCKGRRSKCVTNLWNMGIMSRL